MKVDPDQQPPNQQQLTRSVYMRTKIFKELLNQGRSSEPASVAGFVVTSTVMNLRGILLVGFLLLVTLHARAVAIYDWVPKNEDGSSGEIVLRDDTTIFDPEHPSFSYLPGHDNQLVSFAFAFGTTTIMEKGRSRERSGRCVHRMAARFRCGDHRAGGASSPQTFKPWAILRTSACF
jgi:hypothetical protein